MHTHRFMAQLLALPGSAGSGTDPVKAFETEVGSANAEAHWPAPVMAHGAWPNGWTGKYA